MLQFLALCYFIAVLSLFGLTVVSCDKQYEANFKSLRIEEEDNFVVDVKRSQNECGVIPGLLALNKNNQNTKYVDIVNMISIEQ